MAKLLWSAQERKGFGKQNYNHNEYWLEGDVVNKYKCNRHKFFDGYENNWETSRSLEESWNKDDPGMPEWLKEKI